VSPPGRPPRRTRARALGTALAALTLAAPWLPAGGDAAARGKRHPAAHPPPRDTSTLVAPAADPLWLIACAEDQRRWSDGVLEHFLTSPDPALRARAALAVGRLQDSLTIPALLPRLADADTRVRVEAIFALGQIGSARAREPIAKLLPSADPEISDVAIEALGKLGDRASTRLVAGYLRDPSPRLRAAAAVALWRLADSSAIGALLDRHDDPDPDVRWRVLWALERVPAHNRVPLIVALHLEDPEWIVRAYAARTLGRQKAARTNAYLLERLADAEPAVVVNAIAALVQVADSTSALSLPLLTGSLSHGDPWVRQSAAGALAERFAWVRADTAAEKRARDSLVARLRDRDPATRGAAARALLARLGERALPRVEPLLSDTSVYTRAAVLRGFTSLPAGRATALLVPLLAPGHPLLERMTAAEVLGPLKTHAALAPLRAALADTSVLMMAAAASALADAGDAESVPRLERAWVERAHDADADARISVRDALRALAGRAFTDSLERAVPPGRDERHYPPEFGHPPPVTGAVLHTTAGDITWSFYVNEAPETVRNFKRLAEAGYFDGLMIHRVVPNFVIQDGDPTGTGSGGPGYSIRCEYNRLRYEAGMVGMALSGKDTGGSQWFITHSPQPRLDGRYTIFARVTAGRDVVWRVAQGDRVLKVDILR